MKAILWGNNLSFFNTVGETQGCISFFWMQMFRLIAFLVLFGSLGLMFFVTTTKSFIFLNFWGHLLTTLTFGCLFIGAGMQVCEQKLLLKGKTLEKQDKSTLWMWGIFFYNQAIPFVITSLTIFKFDWFNVENDWNDITSIFYTKNRTEFSYRWKAIEMSIYLPPLFLAIDMCMNKIRIPWHHVFHTVIITTIYFFISYVGQIIQGDEAVYYLRLNWNCRVDCSYIQFNNAPQNVEDYQTKACSQRPPSDTQNATKACRPLYRGYYCAPENKFVYDPEYSNVNDTVVSQQAYDPFQNRDLFILCIYAINVTAFLIFCFVHNFKAKEAKGYDRNKTIKKVRKSLKVKK